MWGESSDWNTGEAIIQDLPKIDSTENPADSKPDLPPLNFDTLGDTLKEISWDSENLVPVTHSYSQSDQCKNRETSEIQNFLSSSKTSVQGQEEIKPILSLTEAGLPENLLTILETSKISSPTTIQSVAWPVALSGKDVIAVACTGSGKTLSYLIPLFLHITSQPPLEPGQGPICIVLVPTRELAKQITFDCNKFGKCLEIRTVCIYGGNGRQFQMKDLEVLPQLVVATPGRLLDFLENGVLNLKRCTFVVVDEGDRMMDMGFGPQLKKILSQVRPGRQCFMCTATWPNTLSELSNEYMNSPVLLNVGSVEYPTNPNIHHEVKVVEPEDKLSTLVSILKPLKEKRVLIFVDTKSACDALVEELKNHEVSAVGLHGQRSTKDRMTALLDFRAGRSLVVVSTDVASRGLDIKDLEHVILYDFPKRIEDYVHRIGRTARGSGTGTAVSLFTKDNAKSAATLVKMLEDCNQNVPRELRRMIRKPKVEGEAQEGDSKENSRPRRRRSRSRDN
jgi:ATP-dependent RNA helicase DDX5/DBP2